MLSREEFSDKEDMEWNISDKSILVKCPHKEANTLFLHSKALGKKFKNDFFFLKKSVNSVTRKFVSLETST